MQTAVLSWTAGEQDKGRVWTQCFVARHLCGAVVGAERCFRVHAERCSRCAVAGDSLSSIASALGAHWRLLFSVNMPLRHFALLPAGMRIKTGLSYTMLQGDTVESVGARFGVMLEHLFRANPEARVSGVLPGFTTQFTCCTSTNVQTLTPAERRARRCPLRSSISRARGCLPGTGQVFYLGTHRGAVCASGLLGQSI